MSFRLLGLTDEQRLEIEQATGMKTEAVKLLLDVSAQQASQLIDNAIAIQTKEVQSVIGPHGSVTRLQAGGVKISQGMGVAVYDDSVLKTTIKPSGDLVVGSNIDNPATTTFSAFVNEQIYNNELMEAGDLLFGDNSDNTSNVKFDASEGQLQFRYGTTVNVYMDTDGTLKAGGGAVELNEDGIYLPNAGDALVIEGMNTLGGRISRSHIYVNGDNLTFTNYSVKDDGNIITNGDFETGDFTDWTVVDPDSDLSVGQIDGNNVAIFDNVASYTATYIQKTVSETYGVVIRFRSKMEAGRFGGVTIQAGGYIFSSGSYVYDDWRNYVVKIPVSTTTIKISIIGANEPAIGYIDDIVIEGIYFSPTGTFSFDGTLNTTRGVSSGSNFDNGSVNIFYNLGTRHHYLFRDTNNEGKVGINIPTTSGTDTGVNANLDVRGSTILNGDGENYDTRIEGDTDQNLFFLDASADKIGIGKSNPSYKLDVAGDINVDTGKTYKVNGTTVLSGTVTGVTGGDAHTHTTDTEGIQDIIGAMFTGNTETGVDVTYQDSDGTIDVELNPEKGSAVLASDYTLSDTSGTYSDTGLSVTLPSAGTWRVVASVRGELTGNAGSAWWITAKLYNSTDAADVADSETLVVLTGTTALHLQNTAIIDMQITVSASKVIKLYAFRKGSGSPTFTTSLIGSDANGRTRMNYERITK